MAEGKHLVYLSCLLIFLLSGCLEQTQVILTHPNICTEWGYCRQAIITQCQSLDFKAACLSKDYCYWCDDEYRQCNVVERLRELPVRDEAEPFYSIDGQEECVFVKGRCEPISTKKYCYAPETGPFSFGR